MDEFPRVLIESRTKGRREYLGLAFGDQWKNPTLWVTILGGIASVAAVFATLFDRQPHIVFIFLLLIALVTVAVISILMLRGALNLAIKDLHRIEDELSEFSTDPQRFHDLVCSRFGVVKEYYSVQSYINEDGSVRGSITQTIKALNHDIDQIEYQYSIPTQETDVADSITMQNETRVPNHIIRVIPEKTGFSSKFFVIEFEGPIKKGESVTFLLDRVAPPSTFLLDPSLLPDGFAYDFSRQRISYPTSKLHMKLIFPKKFKADNISAEACFGRAGVVHKLETARLLKNDLLSYHVQQSQLSIELAVPYPILGLTYMIKWHPIGISENYESES